MECGVVRRQLRERRPAAANADEEMTLMAIFDAELAKQVVAGVITAAALAAFPMRRFRSIDRNLRGLRRDMRREHRSMRGWLRRHERRLNEHDQRLDSHERRLPEEKRDAQ